ncbi:MAG: hypothetical protein J6N52_14375 [Clostridia bacterium]|nr:hypothetical protein [Clostridia bacterium]
MVKKLTRTVAYSCPFCMQDMQEQLNIFDFSGNNSVELLCCDRRCKESCAVISDCGNKYKIKIKCSVCGEFHTYTISKSAFWTVPLMVFNCTNFDMQIFFFGEKSRVEEAVSENDEMMTDMADEAFDALPDNCKLAFSIIDSFHRLLEDKKIICSCGSTEVYPDFDGSSIVLCCENCHRTYSFEISEELLDMLINRKCDFRL